MPPTHRKMNTLRVAHSHMAKLVPMTAALLLVASAALAGKPAPSVPSYTVTELPSVGDEWSYAEGMSDTNRVVGHSFTGTFDPSGCELEHAFLWQVDDFGVLDETIDLGMPDSSSGAYGINPGGNRVAGWIDAGWPELCGVYDRRPVLWVESGSGWGATELQDEYGIAYAVNDSGMVVGLAFSPIGRYEAMVWEWDGTEWSAEELPHLRPSLPSSGLHLHPA